MSRRHARLGRAGQGAVGPRGVSEGWWIEPCAAHCRIELGGARVEGRTELSLGDVFALAGGLTLRLERVPAPAQPTTKRSSAPVIGPLLAADGYGVAIALAAAVVSGIGVALYRARQEGFEARAQERLGELATTLDRFAREKETKVDAQGRYLPSPEVVEAIEEMQRAYAKLQSLSVEEDPLTAHLQRVLVDLSGDPDATVSRRLRDEVARATADLLRESPGARCRAPAARDLIVPILRDQLKVLGDPPERATWLSYIPWIESNYWPDPPLGGDGERGPWQFIPRTGSTYHLIREDGRDDRCDLALATRAAAEYFHDSFEECSSAFPLLAVAAFNTGARNACKLARDESIPVEERDHLGFIQRGLLHPVTHEYVPRWLAASFIGERPEEAVRLAQEYTKQNISIDPCTISQQRVPESGPCGEARERARPASP